MAYNVMYLKSLGALRRSEYWMRVSSLPALDSLVHLTVDTHICLGRRLMQRASGNSEGTHKSFGYTGISFRIR